MLVEFFNNRTEQAFLRSLLSAVQLPKFEIANYGDLLFEGYFYILSKKIIECTKTGYLVDHRWESYEDQPIVAEAEYKVLSHYNFCNEDQNVEFKEIIRASYYSTELHKRFGQYLRVLRDLKHIDLMGMYNCFSYEVFSNIYIDEKNLGLKKGSISGRKVLAVPVKFNKTYTVALTSNTPVYYSLCIKLPNGIFPLNGAEPKLLGLTRFENPIIVDTNTDDPNQYKYNNNLYMIFQVYNDNQSSFVVLEGDYRNKSATIVGSEHAEHFDTVSMIYRPELLYANSGFQFAYSNDVIPYLIHNVIDNGDLIGENITYAKELLDFDNTVNYWTNDVKYAAYIKYLFDELTFEQDEQGFLVQPKEVRKDCLNVTGYIDKQIEGWLNAEH